MDDASQSGGRFADGHPTRDENEACALLDAGLEPWIEPSRHRWHGHLARVVEGEIIPRLMLTHRARSRTAFRPFRKPTPAEIATFAALVLAPAGEDVEARITALVEDGLSLNSLLLDLLTPAARHLGMLWEEDLCDFTELTVAMGRLQRVMHDLSARYGGDADEADCGRSILLCPCPGETHLFGLSIIERFFREAGWEVVGTWLERDADPLALVRRGWFDVAGLSLGCEVLLPTLTETVRDMRRASCNPDLRILVGGSIFVENPGYANLVGADGTATDAFRAVLAAESLLDLRARAC
ncbi:cobalamin B12-binding domain-containing protein [Methylobacterium nigriterrae]|uniref:cobalamin B12-binding domain-containing protein n=1 Tax=Methylobacterium nigriterrae TaxID=3127512 RepID=UPI003013B835